MFPLTSTQYDAERRIWSGPKRLDLYNDNVTLGLVIYHKLRKHPKKIIQIYDVTGEQMSCEELLGNAETLVKQMLQLGLQPRDVVGLYAANTPHVVTVMLASFLCGTPVNSVFPGFDKENLSTLFKATRPKIIFCDVENHANAQSVNEALDLNAHLCVMNGTVEGLMTIRDLLASEQIMAYGDDFRFPCLEMNASDIVTIVCSSGTTSPPKAIPDTHRVLLNEAALHGLNLKDDSIVFSFSTMQWASGVWTLAVSLVNGCRRIITDQLFTPELFLSIVQRHKVTHCTASATQITEIALTSDEHTARKSFSSIFSLAAGGAKVPLIVQEKMNKILSYNPKLSRFGVSYAITELGGLLSVNGGFNRLLGSEGKLCAGRKVRIVSKEGEFLGPNETGQICVAMLYPWPGYCRNEKATHKILVDNWLHTGDIGYFNDDGFLHICSRDCDILQTQHFQIYPPSIEDTIHEVPGVLDVCVFGLPDLVATNLVACAVVRTDDENGRNLKAQHIEDHVKAMWDSSSHLNGGVYFIEALPKTPSGKILRKLVSEQVLNDRVINN